MWPSQKARYFLLYFVLNLFVTVTNKQILGGATDRTSRKPYLLTSIHALATSIGCFAFQSFNTRSRQATSVNTFTARSNILTVRQHIHLALFSLFYTINIALSNWSLALVSLVVNHVIRATAPTLTVIVSIIVLKRSLTSYRLSTGISLILISTGVIIATSSTFDTTTTAFSKHAHPSQEPEHLSEYFGLAITFLGALTAVLKTVLTHKLTTSLSLNLSSFELLQILCPYATLQALAFAYFNGELNSCSASMFSTPRVSAQRNCTTWNMGSASDCSLTNHHHKEVPTSWLSNIALWTINAFAAFLLNVVSFEANKRCGPVSMAVAANLKQVTVLAMSLALPGNATLGGETNARIVIGTILTVAGGVWYARSMAPTRTTQAKEPLLLMSHKEKG